MPRKTLLGNRTMKQAQLPSGEILTFPDKTSDAEIQRAVRRKLGYGNDDLIAAIESFAGKLASLKDPQGWKKEEMEAFGDLLTANTSRVTGEILEAIRDMQKSQQKQLEGLGKLLSTQSTLVLKMETAIVGLNNTLDAALGESLASMEDGRTSATRNVAIIEK